ncbi:MAG: hypothetical protein ACJ8AI_12985, partial [Rhodopila sp.]
QALCTSSDHFFSIPHYETYLFWIGVGIVTAALLPSFVRRMPAARADCLSTGLRGQVVQHRAPLHAGRDDT